MWIIQEPKKVALWNKGHFEEEKQRVCSTFKIFSTYICWINKKMQHLEVSGAVRPLKWSLGVKWLISRAKSKCPEKKLLECHYMNEKRYIECPGNEPTSPRLDAGEKPLEIWLADICCILFVAIHCFNVFFLLARYPPVGSGLLIHEIS